MLDTLQYFWHLQSIPCVKLAWIKKKDDPSTSIWAKDSHICSSAPFGLLGLCMHLHLFGGHVCLCDTQATAGNALAVSCTANYGALALSCSFDGGSSFKTGWDMQHFYYQPSWRLSTQCHMESIGRQRGLPHTELVHTQAALQASSS